MLSNILEVFSCDHGVLKIWLEFYVVLIDLI